MRLCRNPGGPVFLVGAGVFTSPAFSLSSGSGLAAKPPGLTACMHAPCLSSGTIFSFHVFWVSFRGQLFGSEMHTSELDKAGVGMLAAWVEHVGDVSGSSG